MIANDAPNITKIRTKENSILTELRPCSAVLCKCSIFFLSELNFSLDTSPLDGAIRCTAAQTSGLQKLPIYCVAARWLLKPCAVAGKGSYFILSAWIVLIVPSLAFKTWRPAKDNGIYYKGCVSFELNNFDSLSFSSRKFCVPAIRLSLACTTTNARSCSFSRRNRRHRSTRELFKPKFLVWCSICIRYQWRRDSRTPNNGFTIFKIFNSSKFISDGGQIYTSLSSVVLTCKWSFVPSRRWVLVSLKDAAKENINLWVNLWTAETFVEILSSASPPQFWATNPLSNWLLIHDDLMVPTKPNTKIRYSTSSSPYFTVFNMSCWLSHEALWFQVQQTVQHFSSSCLLYLDHSWFPLRRSQSRIHLH